MGERFIVFRSAKKRIDPTHENKNILSRSERQWATADRLPLPSAAFHCRLSLREKRALTQHTLSMIPNSMCARPRVLANRIHTNISPQEVCHALNRAKIFPARTVFKAKCAR